MPMKFERFGNCQRDAPGDALGSGGDLDFGKENSELVAGKPGEGGVSQLGGTNGPPSGGGSVFESFPDMEKNVFGFGFALSLSG